MPASRQYTQPAGMARELIQSTYRAPSFGRAWFGRVLPEVRAGAVKGVIHVVGDSLTVGDDASSDATAGAANNTEAQKLAWRDDGYAGVLRRGLQQIYGDGGEGFMPNSLGVTTGTWTVRLGFGAYEGRATAAASVTWKVRGTSVKLYYRSTALTGSFRWQVDGGSFTTVSTTASGSDPGVVTIGPLSDGEHTVRVEWVSGTIGINGVRGIRGTTGIIVDRIAQHGIGAFDLGAYPTARRQFTAGTVNGSNTITAASPAGFTAADIGARVHLLNFPFNVQIGTVPTSTTATLVDRNGVAVNATATGNVVCTVDQLARVPQANERGYDVGSVTVNPAGSEGLDQAHMVIFSLGANDAASGPRQVGDHYEETLSRFMRVYNDFQASTRTTEFVVIVEHIGKWFDVDGRYPWYAAAARKMADSMNAAVIDCWEAGRRSWLYGQQQGYWSGALNDHMIHLSKKGHGMVGGALLNLLAR